MGYHYCPVCASAAVCLFFQTEGVPVSIGIQWPSASAAVGCPRGDIDLTFCTDCGFIWNAAFDQERLDYDQRYDNALEHSSVFRSYARELAGRLIENHNLRGKSIVEIGCGKGHFLSLLCAMGKNTGIGFDPSYQQERMESADGQKIHFVQDYFSEKYSGIEAEFLCCRHVLEHVNDPLSFLKMVRRCIGDRLETIVYFEVPNTRRILQDLSIWDIIYEHCNYFTAESISHLFSRCGFEVLSVSETYGGQFLALEARPRGVEEFRQTSGLEGLLCEVESFSQRAREQLQHWQEAFQSFKKADRRVVAWGAGAKTVSFSNMLQLRMEMPFAVDVNPHKQGHYLPGTGQRIIAPDALVDFQPDTIVLLNPIYRGEVSRQLRELGVSAELLNA